VATAAGNVMVNVATNPVSLASQSTFTRPFDQQNWNINKENLVYSMANQLSKYDQLDERFIEFCCNKILNQDFNLKKIM
jgi:hypothetical protein